MQKTWPRGIATEEEVKRRGNIGVRPCQGCIKHRSFLGRDFEKYYGILRAIVVMRMARGRRMLEKMD